VPDVANVIRQLKLPYVLLVTTEFATLRFKHLGQHFLKLGDFENIPVSGIQPFIQNIGRCECVSKGAAQKNG
jgi:hypothetical protein